LVGVCAQPYRDKKVVDALCVFVPIKIEVNIKSKN
jgi:hypothetical protein